MNKNLSFTILMIFILGCGFLIWDHYNSRLLPPELLAPIKTAQPEKALSEEEIKPTAKFPVSPTAKIAKSLSDDGTETSPEAPPEEVIPEIPLPDLDDSDQPLRTSLLDFFPAAQLDELFSFTNIIRHFTTTIDNATANKLPRKFSFANHPESNFISQPTENEGRYTISEQNYDRYTGFVNLIEDTEINHIVYVYVQFYPLFQGAYEELGYPDRYFNDRLVASIDHVLDTPEPTGDIELVKPKVFYKFADPDLEALSASQKLMLRIGSDNANRIKTKLRALRTALVQLQ